MAIIPRRAARSNSRRAAPEIDVLVIGSRPIVRLGLQAIVQQAGDLALCGETSDAAEAVQLARLHEPELAVVDLDMRGGVGLKLIQQLKQTCPKLSILALSHQTEAYFAGQVLAAGATGYVTGWEDTRAIAEAMQTVARGKTFLRANLVRMFTGQAGADGAGAIDDPTVSLTERELQVFDCIGTGRSTKQIARQLRISVHTVETYRERMRAKLGALDGTELVYRAIVWKLLNG